MHFKRLEDVTFIELSVDYGEGLGSSTDASRFCDVLRQDVVHQVVEEGSCPCRSFGWHRFFFGGCVVAFFAGG